MIARTILSKIRNMNTKDLEQHYGSQQAAREAFQPDLRVSRELWRQWNRRGVPRWWQLLYKYASNGALQMPPLPENEK